MTARQVRRVSRVRIWADLARAGNLPSVASNVLAAWVLSAPAAATWHDWPMLAGALVAGLLAYAGGATLNDVADAQFDARHRPERWIPQGAVSRRAASWLGGAQLLAGAGVLWGLGAHWAAVVGLVAVIVAYDAWHKRTRGTVLLMAGCRVLLALAVASLPGREISTVLVGWLVALFVYIVVLSLWARREYAPGAAGARVGRQVGRLLAFIPLIDAVATLVVGAWWAALACTAAIPMGRWAQRVAAAT